MARAVDCRSRAPVLVAVTRISSSAPPVSAASARLLRARPEISAARGRCREKGSAFIHAPSCVLVFWSMVLQAALEDHDMGARRSRPPFANAWFFPAAALYAAVLLPLSVLSMLGLMPALPGLVSPVGLAHEMLFVFYLEVDVGLCVVKLSIE